MSTLTRPAPPKLHDRLDSGDRMDQPTFDAIYTLTPEGFKAELIEGTVYVASPVSPDHSGAQARVMTWLGRYWESTPGIELHDNVTLILGPRNEPQPDAALIIEPARGGRTRVENHRLHGPAELVVEVAYSSRAIDLNAKLHAYEAAGVREYLVVVAFEEVIHWFALRDGRFAPIAPGPDGRLRSEVFPGLWLDPSAFFGTPIARIIAPLRDGLASPEHAAFVARLAGADPGGKREENDA